MELIPILSMIILVSTIATFGLAIGSYAMYKVREKKATQQKAQAPATYEAEVVTSTEVKDVQPTPVVVKLTQPQVSKAFEQVNIKKEEQQSTQSKQTEEKQERKGDMLRWR
ncbi:MAG TPA: hypothetical protein PLI27_08360 [Ignavibacteriales bacterium]|nr:hypothetical protein [Ignavibacteriales bacterium]HOL80436.1 hypothetical protein [Ignavibacteriales bacterium]HOM64887.1 hypothetical protein [Ignavibacteriales bacterium]HPD68070.1 hypothetical protein [Ignavibacteriales bacterium]HPP32625.1 hypothetical protein [Ignavibacteriales bacterium]